MTAFTSYGLFWMSLVFIVVFKDLPGVSPAFMGWYLFCWGMFTFFMWFGTWAKNRVIQYVFLSLTILFWLSGDQGLGRQRDHRNDCRMGRHHVRRIRFLPRHG